MDYLKKYTGGASAKEQLKKRLLKQLTKDQPHNAPSLKRASFIDDDTQILMMDQKISRPQR